MTLVLIAGPTDLPVSVADMKTHLRVDHDDEDDAIDAMIRAALAYAEAWCGIAFEAQTWERIIDEFPIAEIELGRGPAVSLTSITYVDPDGVEQTVAGATLDTASRDGWVLPPEDGWPATMATINAVRVRFVVGSGSPLEVRQAIKLLVGHWYLNRETAGESMAEIPMGATALLNLSRRMFC